MQAFGARPLNKRKSFKALRAPPSSLSAQVPLRVVTLQSLLAGGALPPLTNDRGSSHRSGNEPRIRQSLSLTPDVEESTSPLEVPTVVVSQPAAPAPTGGRRGRGGRGGHASPRKRAGSLDFEGVTTVKRRRGAAAANKDSDVESDAGGPRSPLSNGFPVERAPAKRSRGGRRKATHVASVSSRLASPQPEADGQEALGIGMALSAEDRRAMRTSSRPTHLQDYETPAEAVPLSTQ